MVGISYDIIKMNYQDFLINNLNVVNDHATNCDRMRLSYRERE